MVTVGVTGINKLPTLPSVENEKFERIRIGICADLHQDIMHDGPRRMETFIKDMAVQKPDFIVQMGDFCRPYDYNQMILDIWNRFNGPQYHVIGNHDMDDGFNREQVVAFWKAIGNYYSFDKKGYHFVVLDGNDHDPSSDRPSGYARFIGKEQMQWLESDLDKTTLPVIVFLHQGLDNDLGGIYNAMQSRLAWIKETVPYKDPLWALVDISEDRSFQLKGKKSVFVGSSPEDLGISSYQYGYPIVPFISDRKIPLTRKSFEYVTTDGIMDLFSNPKHETK